MASFSVALSGLDASTQVLNVIANNLANLNTPGFKSSAADFSTLFYQNIGDSGNGDPLQVGAGTQVGSISTDFSDGSVNSTGIDSNAAIEGNGFFIVNDDGQQLLTRDGTFTVGTNGLLQTSDGADVLGYSATNGVVNTKGTPTSMQLGDNLTLPAVATSNIQMQVNLQAATAANGTFSTPVQVYDSLGGSQTATATFTSTGAGNVWDYAVTLPASATGGNSPTTLAQGTMTFDSDGNLSAATQVVGGTSTNINLATDPNVVLTSPALADGAAAMSIDWQLMNTAGSSLITQTAAASSTSTTQADGSPSGSLQSFTIESDGTIQGSFSNGETQVIGQLALGNVANLQGLSNVGNNEFATTAGSGALIYGVAGTAGMGQIQGGAVEASNVSISDQFTELIQAQNAYEANAHAVTTLDQIMQDTMAMQTNG